MVSFPTRHSMWNEYCLSIYESRWLDKVPYNLSDVFEMLNLMIYLCKYVLIEHCNGNKNFSVFSEMD